MKAAERWARVPPALRRSVIANLEFDADDAIYDGTPFCDPLITRESRERSRAFKLAARVLRAASRRKR